MELYWIITKNCNYSCRHCHMSGGPGNKDKTISEADFEKVMKHLPDNDLELTLSGGEIFTIPNFYNFLDILKEDKRNIKLTLQTNGFWGKSPSKLESHLEKLANYKISQFDISSGDKWHREQGHKYQWSRNIYFNALADAKIRGADNTVVMPVGRAKPKSINRYKKIICKEYCKDFDCFSLDWRGQISLCCYGLFKLDGNLIEQTFENIIKQNKKDEVFKKLKRGGISEVARFFGVPEKNLKKMKQKLGTGSLCAYLFNEKVIDKKYRIDF